MSRKVRGSLLRPSNTILLQEISSREEFVYQYKNADEFRSKLIYLQIQQGLKESVSRGDFNSFTHNCKLLSYINELECHVNLTSFNTDVDNPLRNTNLIILICKHNRIEFLKYCLDKYNFKNILSIGKKAPLPDDEDETCCNAFYYSIRSCNLQLIDTLIHEWPGKYFVEQLQELDIILSQAFEMIKLNNVPITEELEVYIINKLIDVRISFKSSIRASDNPSFLDRIQERINILSHSVKILESLTEIDEQFIYLCRCIAQNIHVLKRKLRSTYCRLPWEEIEFCLVSFISSCIQKQEINLFFRSVLDKDSIIKYLLQFVEKLEQESKNLRSTNIKQYSVLPPLNRDENMNEIIKIDPQFKELFLDYQEIRDVYSLEQVSKYVKIACSVGSAEKRDQIVILRSLQVIGEHLKNTLESPKLSSFTSELLLLTLPTNTKRVMVDLRNSLSHAHSLSKRMEIEQNADADFFAGIQDDMKKIGNSVDMYLLNNKIKKIKHILKKIIDIKTPKEMNQVLNIMNGFDHLHFVQELILTSSHKTNDHEKLKNLIEELKTYVTDQTDHEREIFRKLDNINGSDLKNTFDIGLFAATFADFGNNLRKINVENVHLRSLQYRAKKCLENMNNKVSPQNLKKITELVTEIHSNCEFRSHSNNAHKIVRIIQDIYIITEFEIDSTQSINEFRTKLQRQLYITHRKLHEFHNDLHIKYDEQLQLKLLDLKYTLDNSTSLKDLTKLNSIKSDKNTVAALEMCILDILSILSNSNRVSTDNFHFLDETVPILIGKELRNHLAHNNFIVDVLFSDPLIALVKNAQKLSTEKVNSLKKSFNKSFQDDCYFRKKFDRGLMIVSRKEKMFAALENGNMEIFQDCVTSGADINSRNLKLWTSLHFAAKGGNIEIVKFLLTNQKVGNRVQNMKDINKQTPLHVAAYYGRNDIVEYFLEHCDSNVNERDDECRTPLHKAAENGHIQVIETLLRYGADLKAKDFHKYLPLHYATEKNHTNAVKILLINESNMDANQFPNAGVTLLHMAAQSGFSDMVQFLIDHGASVHAKTDADVTPLFLASNYGHLDTIRILISRGSDVNARAKDGLTPLYCAVEHDYQKSVEFLLRNGADPNISDRLDYYSPLHLAADNGHVEILKSLLRYNVNPNVKLAYTGLTPFNLAVAKGHLEIVAILIKYYNSEMNLDVLCSAILESQLEIFKFLFNHEKFADIRKPEFILILLREASRNNQEHIIKFLMEKKLYTNIFTSSSISTRLLHRAAINGNKDFINSLLMGGADVNSKDSKRSMAIHFAAARGNADIVKILLENKSDFNMKDKIGRTPLFRAAAKGHQDIVTLLSRSGADVNVRGPSGVTPLIVACKFGHKGIVQTLIDYNAEISIRDDLGFTPLITAIKRNNKDIVKILLAHGADANEDNGKPLLNAIEVGNEEIFHLLLKNGASALENHFQDLPLLHIALQNVDEEIIKSLIKKGVHVNYRTSNNETSLSVAVKSCQERIVKILLNNGADVNSSTNGGMKPLHIAASLGNHKIVEILLEYNANVDFENNANVTALELAVTSDRLENVKSIIKKRQVDVNKKLHKGCMLLHVAARMGNLEIVEFLISVGADAHAKDDQGLKSIYLAAQGGHKNILEYFLKLGFDINEQTVSGKTLLHYSVAVSEEVTEFLVQQGANVNSKDCTNSTPLHYASMKEREKIIDLLLRNGAHYNVVNEHNKMPKDMTGKKNVIQKLLLTEELFNVVKLNKNNEVKKCIEKGAIVNAKNSNGVSVLHYAAWKGYEAIVDLLLENDADPNIIGKQGSTPLHYAAKFSHANIVKKLLSHGAMYNSVSEDKKTPAELTSDRNIKSTFGFIEKSFNKVKSKKIEIIKELQKVKDTSTVEAVMGTLNNKNESLITIAVKNNFPKVEQLKDIFQDNQLELMKLAEYFIIQEQYDKAFTLYKNLLERRKNILGPNNPATLEIQIELYKILYKKHKFSEVLPLLRELLQKQNNILGENHEQALHTKSFIALVLYRQGKNDEAIQVYEEVYPKQLKIVKQKNLDDTDLRNTQTHMSLVLDALDRRDEAIDLTRQVYENHKRKLGALHPQTLVAQNNIAMFLKNQGKYEKALEMFKHVYDKRKKVLGENHSDTLRVLGHIANIYHLQGNVEKSSKAFQNLLKIQETYLGPHHLDVLNTRQLMANLYLSEGKPMQAMQMFNKNIDPTESILGSDHTNVSAAKTFMDLMNQSLKFSGQSHVTSLMNNPENLRRAVITKNTDRLGYLLENNADVNTKYENDYTLLHYAADVENTEIANLLLRNGAIITNVTKKGNTPLHVAALKNNIDVVEVFLKHAKQCQLNNFVNARTPGSGSTALHVATKGGYFEIVVSLLKFNAIYEMKDKEGRLPQMMAKNSKIIKLLKLIDHLFKSVKSGNETLLEELKLGSEEHIEAILNARNCDDKTVVQVAIINKHKGMAEKLLSMSK